MKTKASFILIFSLILVLSCKKVTVPTVYTDEAYSVTDSAAITGGAVSRDGGAEVALAGVVYSKTPHPDVTSKLYTIDMHDLGEFESKLMNLTPSTTYYVRAYATNSHGTGYGEEISFTTLPPDKK